MSEKRTPVEEVRKLIAKNTRETGRDGIKKAVADLLAVYQSQGKLQYFRMNAGDFVAENKDGTKRRVKGHGAGTWDFLVLRPYENFNCFDVIWIEVKRPGGELSIEQKVFRDEQESLGTSCSVVCDTDELREILFPKG